MAHAVEGPLGDVRARVGEGPVWEPEAGRVAWVDNMAMHVHQLDVASGAVRTLDVPLPVGAIAPRARGGYVGALEAGFGFVDPDGGAVTPIRLGLEDPSRANMNDGKCDRAGRFVAGTYALDEERDAGICGLYRLDPDGTVEKLRDGLTVSNGLAWSADDRIVYHIDSPARRVDAFAWDAAAGRLSDHRVAASFPPEHGLPDGMAIDADDHLWIAFWDGWAVRRLTPEGEEVDRIELPCAKVTSCAFAGPDLRDLYITSAWEGLSDAERAEQPGAGGLFRVRVDVPGAPVGAFAG